MFDGNTAPPQLDALSADAGLVTIGMGGNDFAIYDSLIKCQDRRRRCAVADLTRRRPQGRRPHREGRTPHHRRPPPTRQVYVVGYPDILPTEGTCRAVGVTADVLGPVAEIAGAAQRLAREGRDGGRSVVRRHGGGLRGPRRVRQGSGVGQRAALPRRHRGAVPPEDQRHARRRDRGLHDRSPARSPRSREYAEPDPDTVVLNEP